MFFSVVSFAAEELHDGLHAILRLPPFKQSIALGHVDLVEQFMVELAAELLPVDKRLRENERQREREKIKSMIS